MDKQQTKIDTRQVIASLTLSGENPVVRILRADMYNETFSGVKQVLRLVGVGDGRLESERDFMESILQDRRAEFSPSLVVIQSKGGEKKVEGGIRIEVIGGAIEEIGMLPILRV